MSEQRLYRIQPPSGDDSSQDFYAAALQQLIDGPEEVVQVLQLDASMPAKPILLIITNVPEPKSTRPKTPPRETR
jgi:hypothetical protein